jgi:hypothetical protein
MNVSMENIRVSASNTCYNIEPDKTKSSSNCDFVKVCNLCRAGHHCGYQNTNLHHCICLPACLKLPVLSYLCMPVTDCTFYTPVTKLLFGLQI